MRSEKCASRADLGADRGSHQIRITRTHFSGRIAQRSVPGPSPPARGPTRDLSPPLWVMSHKGHCVTLVGTNLSDGPLFRRRERVKRLFTQILMGQGEEDVFLAEEVEPEQFD